MDTEKNHNKAICDPRGTGRNDQLCSDCQRKIARATKTRNRYVAHGPCQTAEQRELSGRRRRAERAA
jgi:hypothetical protein